MLQICLRVIRTRLSQLSSDLVGLIARPHRTLAEIAERQASVTSWLLLGLALLLGYPGFFLRPRVEQSEGGYELVGTGVMPSLPIVGGLTFLLCAALYQLLARQSIPWRRLIRAAGYPIVPYVLWIFFISVLFSYFAERTPTGSTTSPRIGQVWLWSYVAVAVLAVRLQVLATGAMLRCSMSEAVLVVGSSIIAVNALMWSAYKAGMPLLAGS